jgi:hypothetical protein
MKRYKVNPSDVADAFYFTMGHVAILVYFQMLRKKHEILIIIYFLW